MSIDTYLELEKEAPVRHEFVGGQLYEMSGATKRHNLIVGNIFVALRQAAKGTPCLVYVEDVKVRTPGDSVYYPDVMVVCEPEPEDLYAEHAPCLLVEVISPSTELTLAAIYEGL